VNSAAAASKAAESASLGHRTFSPLISSSRHNILGPAGKIVAGKIVE
jgi:hypothetical protein